MHTQVIVDQEELREYAERTVRALETEEGAVILALSGDLGAGKTTFVQKVATVLGVHESVTSPTFVIMRSYATNHQRFAQLVHIDAYRLEHVDELGVLGFAELCTDPASLICIEWPERVSELLPASTKHITFSESGNAVRHADSVGIAYGDI